MIIADVTGIDRGRLFFIDQQPRSIVALLHIDGDVVCAERCFYTGTQRINSKLCRARRFSYRQCYRQCDVEFDAGIGCVNWWHWHIVLRPKLGFLLDATTFYFRHGLSVVQCHCVGHGWHRRRL